jgi:hypothetical protein
LRTKEREKTRNEARESRERVFETNWEEVQKVRRKKKAVGRELKRGWTFLYTDLDGWDGLDQSSSNGWDSSLVSKFRWVLRCQDPRRKKKRETKERGLYLFRKRNDT